MCPPVSSDAEQHPDQEYRQVSRHIAPLPILESHLQPKLHQPAAWGPDELAHGAGASRIFGLGPSGAAKGIESRNPEIVMAEEIKNLRPELHVDPPAGFEVLDQRSIHIVK